MVSEDRRKDLEQNLRRQENLKKEYLKRLDNLQDNFIENQDFSDAMGEYQMRPSSPLYEYMLILEKELGAIEFKIHRVLKKLEITSYTQKVE